MSERVHNLTDWQTSSSVVLAGYDVNGFSQVVDTTSIWVGKMAGEASASLLIKGARAFTDVLVKSDFSAAEGIGDGLLYRFNGIKPISSHALKQRLELACQSHLAASGLSVRAAWSDAIVHTLAIKEFVANQQELLMGPGVALLHQRLADTHRKGGPRRDISVTSGDQWVMDFDGQISNEYCAFVRLFQANQWSLATSTTILSGLRLVSDWTKALNGQIERVSHDEKGIQARLSFLPLACEPAELEVGLSALVEILCEQGFSAAASLRFGAVFRGLKNAHNQVHGMAINQAAKACAKLKSGQVSGIEIYSHPKVTLAQHADKPSFLFGRQKEYTDLLQYFGQKGSRFVCLLAEAGMGKTRLARHLFETLKTAHNSAWFQCGAQTPLLPFSGLRAILSTLISKQHASPSMGGIEGLIQEAMESAGLTKKWEKDCLELCGIVGNLPTNIVRTDVPFRAHYLTRFSVKFLQRLSENNRLLIVIDDAHLLDQLTHKVLLELSSTNASVSCVLASRSKLDSLDPTEIENSRQILQMQLGPLDLNALREIVLDNFPKMSDINFQFVEKIACGNPFVALQAAVFVESTSNYEATSIRELIAARFGNLTQFEQTVVRVTSVFADAVSLGTIANTIQGLGVTGDLNRAIDVLKSKKLVQQKFDTSEFVEIAHDLIGVVVKSEMSLGASILINAEVARALWQENCHSSLISQNLPGIATHWRSARKFGKAAICFARAARTAMTEGYHQTAADLYSRAFECCFDGQFERHVSVAIWRSFHSEVLWSVGDLINANAAALQVHAVLKKAKPNSRNTKAVVRAANIRSETGYFNGDLSHLFGGALIIARASSGGLRQAISQGRSSSTIGYIAGISRLEGLARVFFEQVRSISRKSEDLLPTAYVLTTQGILHTLYCRWKESEQAFESAISILADYPLEQQLLEVVLTSQGHCANSQGKSQLAAQKFEAVGSSAQARGHRMHHGWSRYMMALLRLRENDFPNCNKALCEARTLLDDMGDKKSIHIIQGIQTQLSWFNGEIDLAMSQAVQAGAESVAGRPTNFSSIEGYSAPVLIGALAIIEGGALHSRGEKLISEFMNPMRTFALIYPFARPRMAILEALIEVGRNGPRVRQKVERAFVQSRRNGMLGEHAFATKLLGVYADEEIFRNDVTIAL